MPNRVFDSPIQQNCKYKHYIKNKSSRTVIFTVTYTEVSPSKELDHHLLDSIMATLRIP